MIFIVTSFFVTDELQKLNVCVSRSLKGKFSNGREGALASKFNYNFEQNHYQKWCFVFILESFLPLFE